MYEFYMNFKGGQPLDEKYRWSVTLPKKVAARQDIRRALTKSADEFKRKHRKPGSQILIVEDGRVVCVQDIETSVLVWVN